MDAAADNRCGLREPGAAALRRVHGARLHGHDWGMDAVVFRRARISEAGLLGQIALRSKAHWGYDAAFLEACRAELAFSPADVAARRIVVADTPSGIAGFYSIDGEPPSGELGSLWVVPERIGTGFGRRLWQHAVATATEAGYASLRVEADPNAVGFYAAMGARRVGEVPSGSVPGRALPLLSFRLPGAGAGRKAAPRPP
jgi:GNAT superfamily N-acetyltransferase